jgi:MerR family transcriptional regulator/heat shock protein HspR
MTTEREDVTMPEAEQAIDERAVFIISVAAELAGVHPQTLRIYERKGLVRPKRTSGNTRRYSQADIDRLLAIQELTDQGVNLAGVKRIIELRAQLAAAQREAADLRAQLAHRRAIAMPGRRSGEIVPLRTMLGAPWEARP